MPSPGEIRPIQIRPGVHPSTDSTETATDHYTYSDKIRFMAGVPEKIKGWQSVVFEAGNELEGVARSYFSEILNGRLYGVIGTNTRVYSSVGTRLKNITPLLTSSTAAANSLETQYGTLSADPIATTDGSPIVTITDSDASRFVAGDLVTISGASDTNGILAASLNGQKTIRSVSSGSYTINVGANATSTGSGGGASVVRASGLVNVTSASHGQADGDRIKIDSATAFGGIALGEINAEHIIRNVAAGDFDVMTSGTASSAVTADGGGATVYYKQIPAGLVDEGNPSGYGAGLYGVGLYGTALTSSGARSYPRIWFMDRHADDIILTAGNQTGVYQWDGDSETAPVLVTNAPTKVNYAFVSNNILVTFGADTGSGQVENRILASDYADRTVWTSSSTNQVFDDAIEGAGRLVSHIPVEGRNLIFTENQTYSFRYIGLPFVWEIEEVDKTAGLIAPMARCQANGMGFWMGLDNFYMYRGGGVEIIPSNSGDQSTCLHYVFDDINWGQKSKCFAWFNSTYSEVWFHYPSASSEECDRVAVVNIRDFSWMIHKIDRTAAEYPNAKSRNPFLINQTEMFRHEIGNDNDDAAMSFELVSNRKAYGKNNVNLTAIIPDSVQSGNISFRAEGFLFPQSTNKTYDTTMTVSSTTERIPALSSGRFYRFTWSGQQIGQSWRMGQWYEEVQGGSPE